MVDLSKPLSLAEIDKWRRSEQFARLRDSLPDVPLFDIVKAGLRHGA